MTKNQEQIRAYNRQWYAKQSKERKDSKVTLQRKRRKEIAFKIFQILCESKCSQCGYSNPLNPAALQFHHKNPLEKVDSVSEMARKGIKFERIKEEIDKCEILCANCHAEKTAKDLNWYNFEEIDQKT